MNMIASIKPVAQPHKLRIEPAVMKKLSELQKPVEGINIITDVAAIQGGTNEMRAIPMHDAVFHAINKGKVTILKLFKAIPLVNGEIHNGFQVVVDNTSGKIKDANVFMKKLKSNGETDQVFEVEKITHGSARNLVNGIAKKVFPDERLFQFL